MKKIFAKWHLDTLENLDIDSLHISGGVGDEQFEGLDASSDAATVTIKRLKGGAAKFELFFSVWDAGLTAEHGFWLSPCTVGANETEAHEWGILEDESQPIETLRKGAQNALNTLCSDDCDKLDNAAKFLANALQKTKGA